LSIAGRWGGEPELPALFLYRHHKNRHQLHTYSKGATMRQSHYSLKDVARIVGVKAHRIAYAVSNGYLPEPAQRITNRRLFSDADILAAQEYFAKPAATGRPVKEWHE
jgi:hypothetical protein